jgi:hypothetical protein
VRHRPLVLALCLAVAAALVLALATLAADPSLLPTAPPVALLEGGDLRSEGSGPGLVGNPLLILGAVVALGLGTVIVTLLVARLTRRG